MPASESAPLSEGSGREKPGCDVPRTAEKRHMAATAPIHLLLCFLATSGSASAGTVLYEAMVCLRVTSRRGVGRECSSFFVSVDRATAQAHSAATLPVV